MAGESTQGFPGAEPFAAFWSDFMSRMAALGGGAAPAVPLEATAPMRRALFDALSQHADQFLRSEQFLKSLKQSLDNALAWQQMMNQVLQKGLASAQLPSRVETDHIVLLVRGMEDRLLARLDELSQRIDKLEKRPDRPAGKA